MPIFKYTIMQKTKFGFYVYLYGVLGDYFSKLKLNFMNFAVGVLPNQIPYVDLPYIDDRVFVLESEPINSAFWLLFNGVLDYSFSATIELLAPEEFTIIWGDNTIESISAAAGEIEISHTYNLHGFYKIAFFLNPDNIETLNFYNNPLVTPFPALNALSNLNLLNISYTSYGGNFSTNPLPPGIKTIYAFNCAFSGMYLNLEDCPLLESLSADNNNISTFSCNVFPLVFNLLLLANNQIDSSDINSILALFAADLSNRPTSGFISLTGSNMGTPFGQGLVDKAAIISHGWTVYTN